LAIFFFKVMAGEESFNGVFKQIYDLCSCEGLSFTKSDIEDMPPFERRGYIDLINIEIEQQNREIEKNKKKQQQGQLNG